jgi:hypothetical protein
VAASPDSTLVFKNFSLSSLRRFAVVVFGGSGVLDKPRSIVINGNIFTEPQFLPQYFENIPTGEFEKYWYQLLT